MFSNNALLWVSLMKNTKLYLGCKVSLSQALWKSSSSEMLPLKCCLLENIFFSHSLVRGKILPVSLFLWSVWMHVWSSCLALDSVPTWCPAPSLVSQPQNVLFLWLSLPLREPAHPKLVMLDFLGGAGVLGSEPRTLGGRSHFSAALGWLQSWASCACLLRVTTVTQINLVFSCPMKFKLQEGVKLSLSSVLFGTSESSALVIGKIKEIESKTDLHQEGKT